jgi:dihydrofolate reductase
MAAMGHIVVTEFISLDGVIEGPGGGEDYEHVGWTFYTDEVGFADKMNSMPKYVVSTTLESADWNNSTILRSLDDVRKVRDELDGVILVAGSAQLVQSLLERDLVDELRLMVFPIVLGTGKRLWDKTSDKKQFHLADVKTVGEGIAILTLRR